MRVRGSIAALTGVVLLTLGCASGGGGSGSGTNSRILTPAEMAEHPVDNLYDAVNRLRPRWLEVRTVSSLTTGPGAIVVFLNNSYVGDPEALRQFTPTQVARVRYLDAAQATAQLSGYPSDRHVAGAIVIETGQGRQ